MTGTAIRPFRAEVPQAALDDLAARLGRTIWPADLPGAGATHGMSTDRVRALVDRWRDGFDWRAVEARLNAYPQFVTEIDGEQIHFLHVRSPRPDATPLVLTHGWPGSVLEYLDVITRSPNRPHRTRRHFTWSSRRCPASGSAARPAAPAGTGTAPPAPGPS